MPINLYNSLSREKTLFEPADPRRVTMYVCGPTVYSSPHIGNARPAVVFDTLFRLLSACYPRVDYARNITDLDDKINDAAAKQGVPINVITDEFIDVYHDDMDALGVLPPTMEPRATHHIEQMIRLLGQLIATGFAYHEDGHVLFEVNKFERYGLLSRRDRREMIAGARVEVAPYKRDPADFVLWKPSQAPAQPGWDSPWGWGRPGWHTECVCMIEEHLGSNIDIHGGGIDLQFPHHENEIAQAMCANDGAPFARYWLHNGFVNINSDKMSKSFGNVLLVSDLLEQAPGEAVRFALLSTHYRKPLDWTGDTLTNAKRVLDRLYEGLNALDEEASDPQRRPPRLVMAALADDLNTPKAIAELHELAQRARTGDAQAARDLLRGGQLMGLFQVPVDEWFATEAMNAGEEARINELVTARAAARKRKDFAAADGYRDRLTAMGITLEDGPEGTTWRKSG
ncbi:MAG: cysteine--tRNA ligase [Gammaproteobacteria bacterium]|nr:cysteine--tRNA ligase [Gammaproteobacteria bacterium]